METRIYTGILIIFMGELLLFVSWGSHPLEAGIFVTFAGILLLWVAGMALLTLEGCFNFSRFAIVMAGLIIALIGLYTIVDVVQHLPPLP